jgi:hypothetical protein
MTADIAMYLHRARSAVDAKVYIRLISGMDVAARIAKFCPRKSCLDPTRRNNDRSNTMFAAFVIKRIAGTEFD